MSDAERYCPTCGASNGPEEERCFACGDSLKKTDKLPFEPLSHQQLLQQRYRLLERVGEGGFSTVYKAEDAAARRLVAIKALNLHGLTAQQKIEATDAFNREVHWLSGLSHRNLPRIYNHFSDTECWYLVMDFIEGMTLEKQLERRGKTLFSFEEILDLSLLLCDVLEYLHTRQPAIIFRDLKPANIMLTRDGHLFLIDFGIARQFKPGQAKDTIPFGSPGYAAPEQYGRAQTTPRADIYSLGTILHQLLSGDDPSQTPFSFAPLSLDHPDRAALGKLIMQMVELDVNKRPESVTIVKREVRRIIDGQKWGRSYWGQAGAHQALHHPNYPFPQPAPWPPPAQPFAGGAPAAVAGAGQIQMMQAAATYYPRKQNFFALISMILGFMDFVIPPFLCVFIYTTVAGSSGSLASWLALPALLMPSILAVVFGHIGRHRARTNPGMRGSAGTATAGLAIGYTLGFVYLFFIGVIFAFSHAYMLPH